MVLGLLLISCETVNFLSFCKIKVMMTMLKHLSDLTVEDAMPLPHLSEEPQINVTIILTLGVKPARVLCSL